MEFNFWPAAAEIVIIAVLLFILSIGGALIGSSIPDYFVSNCRVYTRCSTDGYVRDCLRCPQYSFNGRVCSNFSLHYSL